MKNYLFIVEGAHDIAAIQKILKILGVKKEITHKKDLPNIWNKLIPTGYPFENDCLSRVSPIPSFFKNELISVAIKNANSDSKLFSTLDEIINTFTGNDIDNLDGICVFCDADTDKAKDKIEKLLSKAKSNDELEIVINLELYTMNFRGKNIKMHTYAFPNNSISGTLEDLLLQSAKEEYNDLLEAANTYVEKIDEKYKVEWTLSSCNKAIVGCISNALKPGRPNQASIADKEWIGNNTITKCDYVKNLYIFIKKILEI